MRGWALAVVVLGLVACNGEDEGEVGEPGTDAGGPFEAVWGEDAFTLQIVDNGVPAPGGSHYLGMVQTDCVDPDDPGCWTGESCIHYDLDYTVLYCHEFTPAPSPYTALTLSYGADPMTLQQGQETAFPGPELRGRVTYYIEGSTDCAVWGHDPSYYAHLSCDVY